MRVAKSDQTADERMKAIIALDRRFVGKNSKCVGNALKCRFIGDSPNTDLAGDASARRRLTSRVAILTIG